MAGLSRSTPAAPLPPLPLHEYLIQEDEMGDSSAQSLLIHYLVSVLEWLYRPLGWLVVPNLTFYHPAIENGLQMISPDIAVFRGIPLTRKEQQRLRSWDMRPGRGGNPPGRGRPCPPVVFEVSSEGTWRTDIRGGKKHKPQLYGAIGVREYFAYDPHEPRVWGGQGEVRLLGWRYDAAPARLPSLRKEGGRCPVGRPAALEPDVRGWLWSVELESWLAPDGPWLRLYDAEGQLRLTGEEAEAAARAAAEAQAERESAARQEAVAQVERERRAREEAEAARYQLEERLAALQATLRAHTSDPDQR